MNGFAGALRAQAPGLGPEIKDATAPRPVWRRTFSSEGGRGRRRKSVALLGMFGAGNLGNDGSMEAMLTLLRSRLPDVEVTCIACDPDLVAERYGVPTVRLDRRFASKTAARLDRLLYRLPSMLGDLVRTLAEARRFDVVVAPGTGLLDDFGTSPRGWPATLLRWTAATRLFGGEVWYVSIGAGPILGRTSRAMMKAAARLATYRSYRDALSREFMQGIGIDAAGDPVYADMVFRMAEPAIPAEVAPQPTAGLTVGVGVIDYHGWHGWREDASAVFDDYIARLRPFVLHLLDSGHQVRLLTGEGGDWMAVERLKTEVARQRPDAVSRVFSAPIESLNDLMEQIAGTDLVVATRFHNIVCALKMGKPAISLGYARKNDVLMERAGLGDFCDHVARFDPERLIERFGKLAAERECYRRTVVECRDRLRAELVVEEEILIRRLQGHAESASKGDRP